MVKMALSGLVEPERPPVLLPVLQSLDESLCVPHHVTDNLWVTLNGFAGLKRAVMKTKKALMVVGVAVGLGLGGVMPAQAAFSDCPDRAVCLWNNANYGSFLGWRQPGLGLLNVSSGANDRTTSWANRSYTRAAWYSDANGRGFCRDMTPRASNPNVGSFDNDKLSSWRTNGGCNG